MKRIFSFDELYSPNHPVASLSGDQMELVSDYNRKIQEGKIEFEQVSCLCGSNQFDLIASFDRYAFSQSTVLCTKCGLIQSNPRMTASEYAKFYSSDSYRRCYDSDDYLSRYEEKYTPETGKHILEEVQKIKLVGPGTSVLEIGAGGGWNLLPCQQAGAQVKGMDYSPSLVKLGNQKGIPMSEGSADQVQGQYDVIILNHVFEHFLKPVETLRTITTHLKPEGLIYIAVPNIMNSPLTQMQNAHTYYFDPDTFVYYCSKPGLKCMIQGVAQKYHMFGIFRQGMPDATLSLKGHYQKVVNQFSTVRTIRSAKNFLKKLGLQKIIQPIYCKLRWQA